MFNPYRYALAAVAAILLHAGASAQGLVTAEEMRADLAAQAGPVVRNKSLPEPGAPRIQVESPSPQAGPLVAPIDIRVRFIPEAGARIVPDSFRVLYGALGLDITSRVMKYGGIKDNVLTIEHAGIPAGHHRLSLRIRDSEQREAQADLALVVKEK